ncbi:hypothetical protein UFOVP273_69 [uncultured Caudovirales phage]|uniref:Uncharacterized protein n=1 Tax=uncultured Caudovirales phage TaxID=2100421 RepID=A0A6J5LN37_9CAUD|nr:hypothetical protein UFOVP273_69 [uncultured Caudovirales phage]
MIKVVLDGFDSYNQAVGFTHWLIHNMQRGKIKFHMPITAELLEVQYDGVDHDSSSQEQLVMNITVDLVEEDQD